MDTLEMLHQMCQEELSQADVNAIRDSRGFSEQEAATRPLLENFYLSETGVAAVMETLTHDEVVFLHLLTFLGDEVEIPIFVRLYKDLDRPNYGTYTQRYKPVFDHVRRTLIRKGILLFAEDPMSDADTQNERRRYRFPQQFARFLPPPLRDVRRFEAPGDDRAHVLRDKLLEIAPGSPAMDVPKGVGATYKLSLEDGDLRIGTKDFAFTHMLAWQRACWEASVPEPKQGNRDAWLVDYYNERGPVVSPVDAVIHLLSGLAPDAWVHPAQLAAPLRIFHGREIDSARVCRAGYQWGRLARHVVDDDVYYRLMPEETDVTAEPENYLSGSESGDARELVVDLDKVPCAVLAYLNQIADLAVERGDAPRMVATPNVVKIGRRMRRVRKHTLTPWLREHAPDFRRALETVEARWGRHIVHEHLLVARVDDLGLRAQLTHAFQDDRDVVFLTDAVLAFPERKLREVNRVLSNAGHVIKVVEHGA